MVQRDIKNIKLVTECFVLNIANCNNIFSLFLSVFMKSSDTVVLFDNT